MIWYDLNLWNGSMIINLIVKLKNQLAFSVGKI